MSLTFLTGGARSGKSALAVRWAQTYEGPVAFVATGRAGDGEMAERIARHRAERPADWSTVEEPRDVPAAVAALPAATCVVLDCLSLWVSTLLEDGLDEDACRDRGEELGRALAARDAPAYVVTNEVGLGLVPMHPVGRAYRDALGRVNAAVAAYADHAVLVVAGCTLDLEAPSPLPPATGGSR
ncbi:bifunctional adenosylcobinamide kinase/adenosylcobinamide-phosphate guanylyltransferase [Nocardioidaceae bacterium]|nr:bifunctional adenosylcobinamide kinase/adenosylcobinamide-phosphate guanylyltransferase [Nocardioidaceae bacterium]